MIEKGSFFKSIPQVPPDPILNLTRLYEQDIRPGKIDAGVGVSKVKKGANIETFEPVAVKNARRSIGMSNNSPDYLSPSGIEEYLGDRVFITATAKLIFQDEAKKILKEKKLAAIGTPGGTGAYDIMVDTLNNGYNILLSDPTWPNHMGIGKKHGIPTLTYKHLEDNRYNLNANIDAINKSPSETMVVFHTGRTHNPTGENPSSDREWRKLAKAMDGRLAYFDTAYAGFDNGIKEDTKPIRIFMDEGVQVGVGFSYSKNMGLYNERTGGLFIPCKDREQALTVQRYLNSKARTSYSSPSATGERIVAKVLTSKPYNRSFTLELAGAAEDLGNRRVEFAEITGLDDVADQKGLFSMLPLKKDQVKKLRVEDAIYMADTGRINIGGVPMEQIPVFAKAIKKVL